MKQQAKQGWDANCLVLSLSHNIMLKKLACSSLNLGETF